MSEYKKPSHLPELKNRTVTEITEQISGTARIPSVLIVLQKQLDREGNAC